MITAFILFGGLWWWLIAVSFVISMFALIEYEKPVAATLDVIVFVAILVLFSDIKILDWGAANWKVFLEYAAAYLVGGVIWAVIKWGFFLMNQRDLYEKLREQFIEREISAKESRILAMKAKNRPPEEIAAEEEYDPKTINGKNRETFQNYLRDYGRGYYGRGYSFPPMPQKNKARILLWMGYWPFSAFWTLINDPVKRFWRFAYQHMLGLLEGMSKAAFKKYEGDM